ncbi:MAG: hypothetical protein CSYNP_02630 [Syntrophus sp. SKADARSKE-3]|nr:hypothetical protein [Syntrophus sp. SKADARSKE-3]
MMKRTIVMAFMALVILQTLCLPAYCHCVNVELHWVKIEIDGKDVTDNERIEVRPGQKILFKVGLWFVDGSAPCDWRKADFRFTKMESEGIDGILQGSWTEASKSYYYEETDRGNLWGRSQVVIHWKEDGKLVAPGRYLVEIQAPEQKHFGQDCNLKSNILTREVIFKEHSPVPDEIEFDNE